MKKAKADHSYKLYAADTQLRLLNALTAEIEGVKRADDIEYIHRMRVASRRMRAGFDIFKPAFPKKQLKGWKAQIKAVTKTLGNARDCDVQIEYLENYLKGENLQSNHKPGIQRLLLRLQQRREKLQPAVIESMETLEASGDIEDMSQAWRQIRVQARLSGVPTSSPVIFKHAYESTLVRLEEMLVFESVVDQPEQVEQLHEMRIMAKRLRYTLEAFEELYDGALKKHIKNVKEIQSLLGDLHDADVWCEDMEAFIEEERLRTEEYFGDDRSFKRLQPGLQHLIDERLTERKVIYENFRDTWWKMDKKNVFMDLRETLFYFMQNPPTPSKDNIAPHQQDNPVEKPKTVIKAEARAARSSKTKPAAKAPDQPAPADQAEPKADAASQPSMAVTPDVPAEETKPQAPSTAKPATTRRRSTTRRTRSTTTASKTEPLNKVEINTTPQASASINAEAPAKTEPTSNAD